MMGYRNIDLNVNVQLISSLGDMVEVTQKVTNTADHV